MWNFEVSQLSGQVPPVQKQLLSAMRKLQAGKGGYYRQPSCATTAL